MQISSALVGFIGASYCATALSDPVVVSVEVDGDHLLSQTEETFICVCMDWWPETKCDYGWCPWGQAGILNQDLKHPGLINALKALSAESPVHLRMGGSTADLITYQVEGTEPCPDWVVTNSTRLGYALSGTCLKMDRWREIHELCDTAGCDLVFGVNALAGRTFQGCPEETDCRNEAKSHECCTDFTGSWNGTNAKAFFQYTAQNLAEFPPPYALEFGNELVGRGGIQAHIGAEDYARDFEAFSSLVAEAWPTNTPKTVTADNSFNEDWAVDFLKALNVPIDIFTHHMYFLGAGVDPKLPDKIMDPAYLDKLQATAARVQSTVNSGAPAASIWMGETGGAYNSGHPGVTDAFMSGYWYLDNMATLARYGHQAFCRQTLIGGNYGLLNTTTLEPNPDFYTALLWSRLMGEGVLDVSTGADSPASLRAYAHCTRGASDGSVTLLLLNLAGDTDFAVSPQFGTESVAPLQREEYHLTADGLHSRTVNLNGILLAAGDDASIPELKPKIVAAETQLILARYSYAFIVLRGQQSSVCESLASTVKVTVV